MQLTVCVYAVYHYHGNTNSKYLAHWTVINNIHYALLTIAVHNNVFQPLLPEGTIGCERCTICPVMNKC